ncbi:MAG: dTDP-4-dehydrorhamnose reductase [Propionibacteriaceae bacterium]|jgi:dTDP-4-dehydrorhamnose reductase|nr:dTDP-4-dehydrorhamnose reductase [Propionibacteriaceae bacterium]
MRWIIVGAKGMLGQELARLARQRWDDVLAIDRDEIDITDPASCASQLGSAEVVVNCAAWTDVDAAEADEPAAFRVNAVGAANVARVCARTGARLVQLSTDYVFDGRATTPYPVDAPLAPVSAYGRTKAAGEWASLAQGADTVVVRTAWLYGAGGRNFPQTIARLLRQRGTVEVVTDQVGQPTWTRDLADLILRLVEAKAPSGIYHGTAGGRASWWDFAQAVAADLGLDPAVVRPTDSQAFVRPAQRPAYSVLAHDSLTAVGVEPIPDWRRGWAQASPELLD